MSQATLTLHQPKADRKTAPARPPRPHRRRGAARVLVVLAVLLGAGAWFAPGLAGRSGLRHRLVHVVVPAYPGGATVGAASLDWFSPVVLHDVTLTDLDGAELLRVGELRTSLPLYRLLVAKDDLGTVTILRPDASIRLRPDGSNLEDVLRPLLDGPASASGMTVVIEEGRVRWTTADAKTAKGTLENLSVKVVRPAGASLPSAVEAKGRLGNGAAAGDFSLTASAATGEAAPPQATFTATGLPVGAVQPWLDRFGLGVGVEGFVAADIRGSAGPDLEWSAEGRVEGQRLWITMPDLLGDEPLRTESLTLGGKASYADDRLALQKVELRSELGTATADGSFRPAAFGRGDWQGRIDAALAQDGTVTASLDLAKIASSLGRVLRLKEPIASGRLDASLRVSGEAGQRLGVLRVATKDIVAGPPERQVTWREPLTVDLAVRSGAEGVEVERLRAESEGVTLAGSGSLSGAEVRFDADLDRLREQLARLADLPDGVLSGRATGRVTARRSEAADLVTLDGEGSVRSLSVVLPGRRWSERDLTLQGAADVELRDFRPESVASGGLSLKSVEGDELTATLAGPVSLAAATTWPLEIAIKGDIRRWTDRAAAWGAASLPTGWSADGSLDASAALAYASAGTDVSNFSGEARNFRLRTSDRSLDEPYVRVSGSGRWDADRGVLTLSSATLASETAAGKATDVSLPLAGAGPASGRVTFRGGAGRIGRYFLPARPPVWLSGVVGGTLDLSTDATATVADARLEFERPTLTRPVAVGAQFEWQPVWSDDRATAALRARYHHLGDALELTSAAVTATGLSVEAAGRVDRVTTVAEADLSGTVDYDLAPLAARLSSGLPGGVAAKGAARKPFAVRGPLFGVSGIDPALAASAELAWQQVDAFGLSVGPGDLSAALAARTVTIRPFDWAVAGGHVRAAPTISLDGEPTLTLAAGRVAEDIHLTPELCRTWLRYATPALGDSAEMQGTGSLDLAGGTMPLFDPTRARAEGTLVLQGAEATPGPLARSILDAVRQVRAIAGRESDGGADVRLIAPAQSVAVKVADGRVSHDRFQLRLGDANGPTVTTAGSVGFDETLDLVAEVPLDAGWFKDERVASALKGQALRVPIRGTVSRPAPDPRAFQDLARRAGAGAVGGLIDRQIEKQVSDPLRKLLERGR